MTASAVWATTARITSNPSPSSLRLYFGRDLQSLVEYEDTSVPILITSICELLYRWGALEKEGIFRTCCDAKTLESIKVAINSVPPSEIPQILARRITKRMDIDVAASLLKIFLRQLPTGLIPWDFVQQFHNVVTSSVGTTNSINDLEMILLRLPGVNYIVLQYLCRFLHQIHLKSAKSKMTAQSLGIVFGPCVFKSGPVKESDK
ncbi:Protein fam13b, partial [Cichlidogyrus casuarinus]